MQVYIPFGTAGHHIQMVTVGQEFGFHGNILAITLSGQWHNYITPMDMSSIFLDRSDMQY